MSNLGILCKGFGARFSGFNGLVAAVKVRKR